MSALVYMSTILFHNEVSYQDIVTIPVLLEHLVILVHALNTPRAPHRC
jgi:hypothetical protein